MQVFISWSGTRSKMLAEFLQSWLSQVIQAVEPWISSDMSKGIRWSPEISDRLEKSKVGIICLTKENKDEKWILFEAGALSKTKDAYVCTLLINLVPTDLEQPLAQFQHTAATKEDIKKLMLTINKAVSDSKEKSLADNILDRVFETYWPELEGKLKVIKSLPIKSTELPDRTDTEMIIEILELVRSLNTNKVDLDIEQSKYQAWIHKQIKELQDFISNMTSKQVYRYQIDPEQKKEYLLPLIKEILNDGKIKSSE